jgi:cation/acetate symporter
MTIAATNVEALVIFAIVLSITLVITYWASKRMTGADVFWAAGRSISGFQNGLAISGDYLSAASFLGIAGLIYIFGFDGFLYSVGFLVAFLTVMFLLAERMRNAGKYTIADVLSFRLRERPARTAAAMGTLTVAAFYLIAQMVGAGVLIQALVGISFAPAVVIVGAFMLAYVIFGGMLATTWVQIVKAVILMAAGVLLTLLVLAKVGFNPGELFTRAAANHEAKDGYLHPGLQFPTQLGMLSFGIAFVLGTAGLPHILVRFFTVPDAKAARGSVGWAVFLIGAFYLMVMIVGVGARAILGQAGEEAAGKGGNLAIPTLAESLGGGAGSNGGEIFLAVISAVALATILAVVAGLVISASGAVAHDLWSNVARKGREVSEREEVWVAKIAAVAVGALAILLAIAGGAGFNVSALVGLAFCIAASANFPALVLALFWPRFNTAGAVTGIVTGVAVSAVLILLSDPVWPGAASASPSPLGSLALDNPAIYCIPLGFLGCVVGTLLGRERDTERTYHELFVRSETGLGAEGVSGTKRRPRPAARRGATAVATQVLPK